MQIEQVFSSRKEKEEFLKQVIEKLSIDSIEKELYTISLEILDDADFEIFFSNIESKFSLDTEKQSIAPLSSQILS